MKKLLFTILTLTSFSSWAATCTLSLYMPALEYQTADYQNEVKSILKQKGFKIVEDREINRANYKGQYLLSFTTEGVFRFQEVASASLYSGKIAEGGTMHTRFKDSKRTFGGDEFEAYMTLLRRVPTCDQLNPR